ncbi:heme-binding domain-containing protein [Chlorobaculum sp. MV4-Y]|uniref:heme-binding domain-containing protein n=1 Tax=Chlorobaculum sp. MV4-Y TaxID=2976335 RepID=UPI0021AFE467|nr:heme-binding domain-containing protein [Chlorobaculum sp. MV4-Y]UWX56882.1 heme-binding domain-containing protein [Chlorobaculum sp. MV4-Y]
MNNKSGIVAGWIIIASILIQFIPLSRIDQPSKLPSQIPVSVLAVLKSHCFDCHSSETRWPQTAYIAPLSWYVTGKVRQARNALNFARFDALPDADRREIARAASRLAGSDGLSAHGAIPGFPPIRMTEHERKVLAEWATNNNRE